jgi:hypothetical protein
MTELDELISVAYKSGGKQEDVNKVYLSLLRTMLFLPVEKNPNGQILDADEPFKPLFAKINDNYFMLVFDSEERLTVWAGDQYALLDFVEISGRDIIAGVSDQIFLGLNLGTEFYKEFSPDEIKQLKRIVARIDEMRG